MHAETGDLQNPALALRHLGIQYRIGGSYVLILTNEKNDRIALATCKDMSEYLYEMRQFKYDLAQIQRPVTYETRFVDMIMKGFPAACDSWIKSYQVRIADPDKPNMSLKTVEVQLIVWYNRSLDVLSQIDNQHNR